MATLYVASSKGLASWGSDHGVTKHLYKVGVTEDRAEAAIEALNAEQHAGQEDWKLAREVEGVDADEATALARIAAKEKMVDPNYYPGIRKAPGIVKVKLANVESRMLVQQTLRGETPHVVKPKTADIIDYLVGLATIANPQW
ncbi:MAG TPA: hypothetical protein VFS85_06135 [Dongiaceae bacterium]|jgi:hypothetical protein|nr:hypothetical protein [Dongiaceae bacterium]HSE75306.1 hypothetical protein [Dongiaceae bacterium]